MSIEKDGWQKENVSKLFCMKVNEEYVKATKRILFVGRETFGWDIYDNMDEADNLMTLYSNVA